MMQICLKYKPLLTTIALCATFLLGNANASEPFTPNDNTLVIATWKVSDKAINPEQQIKKLLSAGKYPGNSQYYAQASLLLDNLDPATAKKPQNQYYKALTEQYYHHFSKSAQRLEDLLTTQQADPNAQLLLSNMYAVQGSFLQAKNLCTQLIGQVDTIIIAACKLNIDAQQGDKNAISNALHQLSEFLISNPPANLETAIYIDEIRASMASYIHNYRLADDILSQHLAEQAPVSFWTLWADVQLALNKPSLVLTVLSVIVNDTSNFDDALLLRLALAEKALNSADSKWVPLITERIALRELRQDEEHAFDIALYYLHINNNPQEALKWASINWQQAKLKEDELLLKEAQEYAGSSAELYLTAKREIVE